MVQMDTLGIEATPEEVDLMIDEIDQDNNGEIDFDGKKPWGGVQYGASFFIIMAVYCTFYE